jgi:hypothetical protein
VGLRVSNVSDAPATYFAGLQTLYPLTYEPDDRIGQVHLNPRIAADVVLVFTVPPKADPDDYGITLRGSPDLPGYRTGRLSSYTAGCK